MLVVVFVLGIGLIGALSFFNINLNNQFEAKNELIAAGLTQEGADLVRNIVDYNYLKGDSWYKNLSNRNGSSHACKNIDINSLTTHDCISSNNKNYICSDASKRYYQCNDNTQTFTRELDIVGEDVNGSGVDLDAGDCLSVSDTVSWNGRSTVSKDIICKPRQ
jgi:Tfp pilus assembly protein PilV